MLALSVVRAAAPIVKRAVSANSPCLIMPSRFEHHDTPHAFKHPTMDELPVPCGSWQENYDNNQRKYNIHLLFGAGFFLVTAVSCYYAGVFNLYLLLPDKPAPRNAM